MTDKADKPIGLGYSFGQLLKALASKGEKAQIKAENWHKVLGALIDGTLRVGARQPLAGVPAWVTLNVVTGGFATGDFAAGGALTEFERAKIEQLKSLSLSPVDSSGAAQLGRRELNLYYLSTDGQAELSDLLKSGCYRIRVPEEGALLVVAWLIENKQQSLVPDLIAEIAPFFDRIRFFPQPDARPLRANSDVFVRSVGETVAQLRAKRPNPALLQMRESINVWTPLYDQAVGLFLETVDGPTPAMKVDASGELVRAGSGQPVVSGGWPCVQYPSDWSSRAQALLNRYTAERACHGLCKKPDKPKENFARLRHYLAMVVADPKSLSGRDVGVVRKILASYVTSHGAPDSAKHATTRRLQCANVSIPLHSQFAQILAGRLSELSFEDGVSDLQQFKSALTVDEAKAHNCAAGRQMPDALLAKLELSRQAPLEQLVNDRIVKSGETLAALMPLLSGNVRAQMIDDPALARLFLQLYIAFRKRRSLLLLNLESQVKLEELPWFSVFAPWINKDGVATCAAKSLLVDTIKLNFCYFPQTILPNKLVRELRTLSSAANLDLSFVDEIAADIFMEEFRDNFLVAAQQAGRLLNGTLYARYYAVDYATILCWQPAVGGPLEKKVATEFTRLCNERAAVAAAQLGRTPQWSVAYNGVVLEQAQILTTHNLATLFVGLDLGEQLSDDLIDMCRKCFAWICGEQQKTLHDWHAELIMLKNTAYAWRQMIFYLALLDDTVQQQFINWCHEHLSKQSEPFRERFAPALSGLMAVAKGETFDQSGMHIDGGRLFLGWTIGPHWLSRLKKVAPES